MNGDVRRYDIVKGLMQKLDLWEKSYQDLLNKLSYKLSTYSYAKILEKEKEYERLLSLVTKHKNLIEQYFNPLAKYYPEEAYDMYYEYIVFTAKQTSSRSQYKSVCDKISVLYNAGGMQKAIQLVKFLKAEYPRRPAFQDELNRMSKKFNHIEIKK